MAIKLLINSCAGVGKTQLLASLGDETLVISRDIKKFPLALPHMLVERYYGMDILLYGGNVDDDEGNKVYVDGIYDKLRKYMEAKGKPPVNVVIDTVSQIWMDVIEESTKRPNKYGSQAVEQMAELAKFTAFIHEVLEVNGINVILLNHVIEEKIEGALTGDLVSFGQGKFATKSGFYSVVNESVSLVIEGLHRVAYLRDHGKLARTLNADLPAKQFVANTVDPSKSKKIKEGEEFFDLKNHLDLLMSTQEDVEAYRL